MASSLFSIGLSGLRTSRAALDLTAQNISNAGTEGYVRRSLTTSEVASVGSWVVPGDLTLSGVRVDGVARNADMFRQAEVRRTAADQGRAAKELTGFENIEAALEQSGIYPAMTAFEGSLQRLESNPIDPALRAGALEDARTVARNFNLASDSLKTAHDGLVFAAQSATDEINVYTGELARVNLQLTRARSGSSDQTMLLDQRDNLLQKISERVGINTAISADQSVTVRLNGSTGPVLVSAGTTQAFAMTTAADGTIGFTLGGTAVAVNAGALAGQGQALIAVRDRSADLDAIANGLMTAANTAQANGAALDGSAGQPLFSGVGAAGITLALASGAGWATAPAGSVAGSRNAANLVAMRNALVDGRITDQVDSLMFTASSGAAARRTTADALDSIASSARLALAEQAGVSLDDEAADLVRFQQAFQASGKVIQVAGELFDTLLAIR
ncbi:MAG: flagellar hook-associated protein FlgK [Novosphingobium sp.]